MDIANQILEHYQSEDLKSNYCEMLLHDTHSAIQNIKEACNGYDFEQVYGQRYDLSFEQAESILNHIIENVNDFTSDFHNYYIPGICIDSKSFGEQEQQLTGLYNGKLGKEYNLRYLKKAFNDAGFTIVDDCAYYDLSGQGVYINLLKADISELLKDITN